MFVVATTALADKLALPTLGTSPLLAGEAKAALQQELAEARSRARTAEADRVDAEC